VVVKLSFSILCQLRQSLLVENFGAQVVSGLIYILQWVETNLTNSKTNVTPAILSRNWCASKSHRIEQPSIPKTSHAAVQFAMTQCATRPVTLGTLTCIKVSRLCHSCYIGLTSSGWQSNLVATRSAYDFRLFTWNLAIQNYICRELAICLLAVSVRFHSSFIKHQ